MCVRAFVRAYVSVCTCAGLVCDDLIQYYDYKIIIFEVLMSTFLLIVQSPVCSPLLVRYGATELTAIIIITAEFLAAGEACKSYPRLQGEPLTVLGS